MNKSLLVGIIGGIGIATAGGVAGYALMSKPADFAAGSAAVENIDEASQAESLSALQPAAARAPEPEPQRTAVAAAAPRPAATAAPRTAGTPAPRPAAVPAPEPTQECWDEVVEVQATPRDKKAIAGTATGALLGGAIAKRLGDDKDLVTAAGAAAGAFAGRKLQREIQENNTTTTVERRCAPAQ